MNYKDIGDHKKGSFSMITKIHLFILKSSFIKMDKTLIIIVYINLFLNQVFFKMSAKSDHRKGSF
jgi:hypothetical protein